MTVGLAPTSGKLVMQETRDILIVNQVIGPLMLELLAELQSKGWNCHVFTGELQYDAKLPEGVSLSRGTRLVKAGSARRIWTWGAFTLQAALAIARHHRIQCLVVSNPPLTMLLMPLLRRLLGSRYSLLIYDVYPETMIGMGMLSAHGLPARLWRGLSRASMRRADGVVTLGGSMRDALLTHLRAGDPVAIEVIPPWVDTGVIRPIPKDQNPFVQQHGLQGKLVIMYSGAFGATHGLGTLVEAARQLQDVAEFVMVGGGTCEQQLREQANGLPNLKILPYQPNDRFPFLLAAADCMVVCLDEQSGAISVPSKLYYAMAAGAGVIALAPSDSEPARVILQHGCGIQVPPGDAAALAQQIRNIRVNPELLATWQARSREAAVKSYDRGELVGKLAHILTPAVDEQ